jgi:hypothetical protein
MPSSRRRRTTILIAIGAVVVGVVLGVLVGRSTAPSLSDQVNDARSAGIQFSAALRVLPLEYEKVYDNSGGQAGGAQDIVDRSLANYDAAVAAAPWITTDSRGPTDVAIDAVRRAPAENVLPAEFNQRIDDAAAAVETLFGVPASAATGR